MNCIPAASLRWRATASMRKFFNIRKTIHASILISIFALALITSLYMARAVEQSNIAQELVAEVSYLGVLIVAIIAGLNALVPIPAVTFVPIFLAGGLSLPIVIATLVAGTLMADLAGFYFGRLSSRFVVEHYPGTYERIKFLHEKHDRWLPFFVFFYAGFVPFPNEAYLIPFGILGIPLLRFIIPITLGTIAHQAMAAYGMQNIFQYFF